MTVPGGVLALPSNIGARHRDAFACVPEVGLNIGVLSGVGSAALLEPLADVVIASVAEIMRRMTKDE